MAKWKLASINMKKTMLTSDLIIAPPQINVKGLSHSEKKGGWQDGSVGKSTCWMSEHSPRVESSKGNSECLWENDKSLVISVSSKTQTCSWDVFSISSQVWQMGVSLSLLWLLIITGYCYLFICLYGSCSLSLWLTVDFTHVTLLNPQSINVWCSECTWLLYKTLVYFILPGSTTTKHQLER